MHAKSRKDRRLTRQHFAQEYFALVITAPNLSLLLPGTGLTSESLEWPLSSSHEVAQRLVFAVSALLPTPGIWTFWDKNVLAFFVAILFHPCR